MGVHSSLFFPFLNRLSFLFSFPLFPCSLNLFLRRGPLATGFSHFNPMQGALFSPWGSSYSFPPSETLNWGGLRFRAALPRGTFATAACHPAAFDTVPDERKSHKSSPICFSNPAHLFSRAIRPLQANSGIVAQDFPVLASGTGFL